MGSERNRGERTGKKDVRKTWAKLKAKKTNAGLIKVNEKRQNGKRYKKRS